MESLAPLQLAALSHPQRLALFRLLVRRFPDEVPAGDIAGALGCKANTTSIYLGALLDAGLVTKRRKATSLLYRAHLQGAQALMRYLLSDCCRDRLDLDPSGAALHRKPGSETSVLFICSGNSSRSICAETILRDTLPERVRVFSAGHKPAQGPNPVMLDLLSRKGHGIEPLYSKDVSLFRKADAPRLNIVITLCDRAANQDCPVWPGHPVTAHWGLDSPTRQSASDADPEAAFERTYAQVASRLRQFAQLDFETLPRAALQSALDHIGSTTDGTRPA